MQTCNFEVNKGKNCAVIASRVVALVIPIVILLLTTAIFSIYCFKKKAERAERSKEEICNRLPQLGTILESTPYGIGPGKRQNYYS